MSLIDGTDLGPGWYQTDPPFLRVAKDRCPAVAEGPAAWQCIWEVGHEGRGVMHLGFKSAQKVDGVWEPSWIDWEDNAAGPAEAGPTRELGAADGSLDQKSNGEFHA